MTELSVFVDFVPKKGNPTNSSQHQTSCHWFDWKFNKATNKQIARISQTTSSQPPTFAARLNKLEQRQKAQTASNLLRKDKPAFQFGEAHTSDIFCFSQHDNRHQIDAPEKKIVPSVPYHKSISENIRSTMFWEDPTMNSVKKTFGESENVLAKTEQPKFRRFPKKHKNIVNRAKTNILAHDNDKNKPEISLQILAQPQSYTGNRLDIKSNPNTGAGWCYSLHGKTFSKRVSNATKHACYRF